MLHKSFFLLLYFPMTFNGGSIRWIFSDNMIFICCFLVCTQRLCVRGSQILQTKSQTVEEAANELINMLCDEQSSKEEGEEEAEEEEDLGFEEEPEADGEPIDF